MLKLAGVLFWILGDWYLLRHLIGKEKQKADALEEMLLFLRILNCDVNEWKLPLEEALSRQKADGTYRKLLWEEFCLQKEQKGIRSGLLSAVQLSLPVTPAVKQLLNEYLSQLGRLKKEPAEELYQRVRSLLEEQLKQEKEALSTRQRLIFGFVGSVSTITMILLW